MTNYGDILLKSLKFSINPKRWLPFFIVDVAFMGLMLQFVLSDVNLFIAGMASVETNPALIGQFIGFLAVLFACIAIWSLVRLWVQGAVIQQSFKEKEKVSDTFRYSLKRYPSLLVALIIVSVIGGIAGMVPYIGWVLSIIAALVLLFTFQSVIVSKLGFAKALGSSYHIFRKRPGSVFLAWLAMAIISLVITGIFLLPALALFGTSILPAIIGAGSDATFFTLLSLLMQNIYSLVAAGIVFLLGSSVAMAFSNKATTEFYLAWGKKKAP